MLSKKSQPALRLISCRKTKHATIARRYALRPVVEVTGEFIALSPHLRLGKIAFRDAKRLFRRHRPQADIRSGLPPAAVHQTARPLLITKGDGILDSTNFERMKGYLNDLLREMPVTERIERLSRLHRDPRIESFISDEERHGKTKWLIHYDGLKPYFDGLSPEDSEQLKSWAVKECRQAEIEHHQRELDRLETKELPKLVNERLPVQRNGRRIAVFLDGTSNTPEELRHIGNYDLLEPPPITNVVRLLRGVVTDNTKTDLPQIIGYFRGVATEGSTPTRLVDGLSGHGLSRIVLDAYRFISHNLEWSGANSATLYQDEVYIFGFSRGAYAARALSGFLNKLGLIRKDGLMLLPFFFSQYQKLLSKGEEFDARTLRIWENYVHPEYRSIPVKFLGVWDTVGSLGIPVTGLSWITVDYDKFHDTTLTKNVTHAYQALAIHELRRPFKPVFWTKKADPSQTVEQVWFAGAHSNVGGGYEQTGLSSYALDWMAYKAQQTGLVLDLPYFKSELGSRKNQEPIALSRNFRHGKPGSWSKTKMYRGRLERPLELAKINAYLAKYFPAQRMDANIFQQMRTHWSVGDRLKVPQRYLTDKASFARLDAISAKLPAVARTESLV
jgi:uncharacterized protein (DUF2235 family)